MYVTMKMKIPIPSRIDKASRMIWYSGIRPF